MEDKKEQMAGGGGRGWNSEEGEALNGEETFFLFLN